MILDYNQICSATCGAAYIEKKDRIIFHRFTKEQESIYLNMRPQLTQIYSTAGILLSFNTDSDFLELNISVDEATLRKFFSFDIFENGKLIGYLDNLGAEKKNDYLEGSYNLGNFKKKFELGTGVKNIEIYFPWSVKAIINELIIADGAFFEPAKPKKALLVFGDSITIGENVIRPSNRYCSAVARKINAQEFNKAIGGEHFCPYLSELKDSIDPDYILVAYGTNDWAWGSKEEFINNCTSFFENLNKNYPFAQIFTLTPIWRKDYLEHSSFMPFKDIKNEISDITKIYDNVFIIDGFDLIPHDEKYFSDKRLHPNDLGQRFIADGLIKFIKKVGEQYA